jgi:CysZ protein
MIFLIVLGIIFLPDLSSYIDKNLMPEILQGRAMRIALAIFLWLSLLIAGFVSYREVVLIIFAPLLGFLSEKVETAVFNKDPLPFNFKNLFIDIWRSVRIEAKIITWMVIITFAASFLAFIPLAGVVISPVLIFLIQSYYNGLRFVDYTLERKRYSVQESAYFAKTNRARIIGIGLGFNLLLIIPVIGWFLAPGYGAIAGTLGALEKIHRNSPEIKKIKEL